MKKLFAFFSVALLPLLYACNGLIHFNLDYNEQVTYTSSLPINSPISLYSPDITTNSEQSFQNNNTNADRVRSVKLKQLTLTITSPPGQTFSFLKNIQLYISADNLPEVEIARKDSIPANVGASLDLDVNDVELEDYVKAETFKLRTKTTAREFVTQNTDINIYSRFRVEASIFKK